MSPATRASGLTIKATPIWPGDNTGDELIENAPSQNFDCSPESEARQSSERPSWSNDLANINSPFWASVHSGQLPSHNSLNFPLLALKYSRWRYATRVPLADSLFVQTDCFQLIGHALWKRA